MSGPFSVRFDYVKSSAQPLGHGYDLRPAVPLTSVVWHSTEHGAGQSFASVCAYLRDSADVSSHYAVDVDGEIQRLLDPGKYRAWHAGASYYEGRYDWNDFAVGVELFHRQGDPPYPQIQLDAAAWLMGELLRDKPTIVEHVMHRQIACNAYSAQPPIIYGRKIDPSGMSLAQFQAWICSFKANP